MEKQTLTRAFRHSIHQTPKWVAPEFKNNLCCGLFDLAIASSLLKDDVPSGNQVRRQVNQLVKWSTTAIYKDGHYSRVGEFFDAQTIKDFADVITTAKIEDNRGFEEIIHAFKGIDVELAEFETEEELGQQLEKLSMNQIVVFPYEPAYFAKEEKRLEDNGDHFLHFGIILPNIKNKKHYRIIQTSMGREVKKPCFNPLELNHYANVAQLFKQNMKPKGFGYKWQLQFPWKSYKGDHAANFSIESAPKYQEYSVSGQMLILTKEG